MKTFYQGQLVEYKQKQDGRNGAWYSARYVRPSDRNGWHRITPGMLKAELEVPARRLRATIRWEVNK